MNVLSLFDGMACGLVALKRSGIQVDNYYASEIDKYAIQIAKKNHPEIQHLGNIEDYESWDLPKIDLIIGGSPCQGFSFAGKQLNFNDPRSALFFKFVEILWKFKPDNFLMENVKMKKEYSEAISELLEVEPVLINSALVSAQNRKRLYWCDWDVDQPEDKEIFLKDIAGGNGGWGKTGIKQSGCVMVGLKSGNGSHEIQRRVYSQIGKAPTLMAMNTGGPTPPLIFIGGIE